MRHICISLFLFCQIFSSTIFNLIQKPISGIHHLVTYFASHRANFELFYHSTWNDEQQKMDHLTWKNNRNTSWCGGDWQSGAQCDKFTKKCSILLTILFCWFFEQLGFFPLFNMNNDIATQDWYKLRGESKKMRLGQIQSYNKTFLFLIWFCWNLVKL